MRLDFPKPVGEHQAKLALRAAQFPLPERVQDDGRARDGSIGRFGFQPAYPVRCIGALLRGNLAAFEINIDPAKAAHLAWPQAAEDRSREVGASAATFRRCAGNDCIQLRLGRDDRPRVVSIRRLSSSPTVGAALDSPRRRASLNIPPNDRTTRLIISADRPASRNASAKVFTAGTVRLDSFFAPMNGTMCRSTCSSYPFTVMGSRPFSLHRLRLSASAWTASNMWPRSPASAMAGPRKSFVSAGLKHAAPCNTISISRPSPCGVLARKSSRLTSARHAMATAQGERTRADQERRSAAVVRSPTCCTSGLADMWRLEGAAFDGPRPHQRLGNPACFTKARRPSVGGLHLLARCKSGLYLIPLATCS